MIYNRIYDAFRSSPGVIKKLIYLVPIEYRFGGKNFKNQYEFLKNSEKWDNNQIESYQKAHLQRLLKHAVKNVPYYKDIKLSSDNPFKNLERFPVIDKETLQEDINQFISTNISKKNAYYVSTGGTSGNQLKFYLDNSTYGKEWAFVMAAWRRVGFNPGDSVVSLRGVDFKNADKGIFWQDNPIYNMLEMSPFHLSEKNIPNYIEKIKKFKPKFIHGYPSAISILAKYISEKNEDIPSIKGILAVSENLYSWQRQLIEESFNARVFSFYGQSERVIMAAECEKNNNYHVFPEYGITELLDENNNPINSGDFGELVGTGFLNYYMPFIRYKTGDYAKLDSNGCDCKRNHILIKDLIGRWNQEMIFGKDGSFISTTALNLHSNILEKIIKFQFYQEKEGELFLRIESQKNLSFEDKKLIKESFFKKVGSNLEIIIEEVDEIPLTKRGKYKLLIQKIRK